MLKLFYKEGDDIKDSVSLCYPDVILKVDSRGTEIAQSDCGVTTLPALVDTKGLLVQGRENIFEFLFNAECRG